MVKFIEILNEICNEEEIINIGRRVRDKKHCIAVYFKSRESFYSSFDSCEERDKAMKKLKKLLIGGDK